MMLKSTKNIVNNEPQLCLHNKFIIEQIANIYLGMIYVIIIIEKKGITLNPYLEKNLWF